MRKWLTYTYFSLFFLAGAIGQTSFSNIVDHIMFSVNRSAESSYEYAEVQNLYGFGLGVYSTIWKDEMINLLPGIEFNQSRLKDEEVIIGHFYSYEDLVYTRNCITIPLVARINFTRDPVLFMDAGVFWDWVIAARQKGVLHSYIPDVNWEVHHRYTDVNEMVDLQNSLGYSIGLGVRIKGSEFDFLIKPEYRHSFTGDHSYRNEPIQSLLKLNVGFAFHGVK